MQREGGVGTSLLRLHVTPPPQAGPPLPSPAAAGPGVPEPGPCHLKLAQAGEGRQGGVNRRGSRSPQQDESDAEGKWGAQGAGTEVKKPSPSGVPLPPQSIHALYLPRGEPPAPPAINSLPLASPGSKPAATTYHSLARVTQFPALPSGNQARTHLTVLGEDGI